MKDDISAQFIISLRQPTFCLSVCQKTHSGCHDFGKILSSEFKSDYIGLKYIANYNSEYETEARQEIINSEIDSYQIYINIVVTGCCLNEILLNEILKLPYNFQSVINIFKVCPPVSQINFNPIYYKKATIQFKKALSQLNYKGDLLTSGLASHFSYSIGHPPSFPLRNFSRDNIIPSNCFGLIYLPDLKSTHSYYFIDEFECLHDINFLQFFFHQILSISHACGEHSPSVLAITSDPVEINVIESVAQRKKIQVTFVQRYASEYFLQVLNSLKAKKGIFATNGIQTLIQALSIKCKILYFLNKTSNTAFCEHLVSLVAKKNRKTAKIMFGLHPNIRKVNKLNNKKVKLIQTAMYSIFTNNSKKFISLKEKYYNI